MLNDVTIDYFFLQINNFVSLVTLHECSEKNGFVGSEL